MSPAPPKPPTLTLNRLRTTKADAVMLERFIAKAARTGVGRCMRFPTGVLYGTPRYLLSRHIYCINVLTTHLDGITAIWYRLLRKWLNNWLHLFKFIETSMATLG
jgi:hypothetical protein